MWLTPAQRPLADPDRFVRVARRSPDLRTRQLHRAITHTVHGQRSVGEREASAEVGFFRH